MENLTALNIILCIFVGYLFGCIQTSYIVGKILKKIDIRDYGSGNAGATNAVRVFGSKIGIFCLIIDALKGAAALLIIASIFGIDDKILLLITGLGAIFGHNYPFYMHFKGGKGIATMLGIFAVVDWRVFLLSFIPALIILVITRYMSLTSLLYSLLLLIFMIVFYYNADNSLIIILLTFVFTALAFWRHRANIKRLLNGTESKFNLKQKFNDLK